MKPARIKTRFDSPTTRKLIGFQIRTLPEFQQSAYKLSLFLRDESGQPRVIDESHLPPEFPQADDPSA